MTDSSLSEHVAQPVREPSRSRAPRVACIMMQKNEDELLEPWIVYHGHLFGYDNLFVFDNGSDSPRALAVLEKYADRITVIRDRDQQSDFESKGRIFGELIRRLEKTARHDFFMPLDCDEFIALNAPGGEVSCSVQDISSYLGQFLRDPRLLRIKGSYFNVPGKPAEFVYKGERKCFFAYGSFVAVHIGFHGGKVRGTEEHHVTELVHLHFRYKPFHSFIAHAKQKMQLRVPNFLPETLRAYQRGGRGVHLCEFLLMTEEQYYRKFAGARTVRLPSFEETLNQLGMVMPFSGAEPGA